MTSARQFLTSGSMVLALVFLMGGIITAQSAAQSAASKEYRRLVNLSVALRRIPFDKQDKEPYRSFLKRNDKDILYSDPSGEWYVRSDRFWDLRKKYARLAIADRIAWTAAENPLGGECEGYVPCYLASIRRTYGEYLTLYPNGAYSKRALKESIRSLSYMADEAVTAKKNFDGPKVASDDAEFRLAIHDLRRIFAKVRHPEKAKALTQLKQIEEGFR